MIKVQNLNKYYNRGRKNENHVLKDINLEFESTGLVCILGESGCGKTTLLNTIGGLDDFYSGNMEVGRSKISKYSIKTSEKMRNDNLGFVFQNYYLLSDYTVAYNIRIALNIYDLTEEEKDERVDYVLKALDITKYKKKLVSELSGGQQQRVSIARALVKAPKIILADEPTGNLDEENTIRTMSILKNISKECLVIVVTHEKDIAKFFADRIIKIVDGEVAKDKVNKKRDAYIRKYDSNIYLKEMDEYASRLKELDLHLYKEKNDEDEDLEEGASVNETQNEGTLSVDTEGENTVTVDGMPIKLTFAYKDGKLYIKNESETDVILTSEDDDCQIIDDYMPKLEMKEVMEFDFKLPELENKHEGSFTARETYKLAKENIKVIGKKQFFIIIILLLTAVLTTIGMANYINKVRVPVEDIVTTDSRYVQVMMETKGNKTETQVLGYMNSYINDVLNEGTYREIYGIAKNSMDVSFNQVVQMKHVKGSVEGISFVSYNHLDPETLVCGRMAENPYEVVVDEWVIDRIRKNNGILAQMLTSDAAFLGETITEFMSAVDFEIVGVCKSNEPSVYMNDISLGLVGNYGIKAASVDQINVYYPDAFTKKQLDLGNNDIIISKEYYEKKLMDREIKSVSDGIGALNVDNHEYTIVEISEVKFGADVIVNNDRYNTIKFKKINGSRGFIAYARDAREAAKYFKKMNENYNKYFDVNVSVAYDKEVKDYRKSVFKEVQFTTFLTLGIFIISLIMIYFMIKSNAMSRSEELTVYRLIGISRMSVLRTYMLEISMITVYTMLPAIIITTALMKFIASVPSLEMNLNLPWALSIGLFVVLLVVNNIISIMPVYGILSKPPARLARGE
ncbi:MAG: ATP-binding cassette domain-containing protein [Lachnospiraceae bacterium]|nr:ATP-binding cassette domain-containing protein [Lachnospiraceae bacterium]